VALRAQASAAGTIVLAAFDDGPQDRPGRIDRPERVHRRRSLTLPCSVVDLFILQAYRSGQLVRKLYKEVERLCAERNIRFIMALPNDKSV